MCGVRLMYRNLLLSATSFALSLLAGERWLRSFLPVTKGYSVLVPGTHWTVRPQPEMRRGIQGVSHYRVNWSGIRGRPFSNSNEYRILAVGGSTTECAVLDDSEAWPRLLEDRLGTTTGGQSTWVG